MKRLTLVAAFARLLAIPFFLATVSPLRADDYAAIAGAVASPLVSKFEDIEKAYADGQVMLRVEWARQQIHSASPVRPDLSGTRDNILRHLDTCYRSMQQIRRLDSQTPDVEQIIMKTINASPALLRSDSATGSLTAGDNQAVDDLAALLIVEGIQALANAWNASTERDNYRNHYRLSRTAALPLAAIAKNRCTGTAPLAYGIGVAVRTTDDALLIDQAIPDSPAAKADLRKGDEIIAVNSKPVKTSGAGGTSIDREAFRALRGPRNSTVKVTYSRGGITKTIDLPRSHAFNFRLFDVDFDGSWNATFATDALSLRNVSGTDLTNCTLRVTLVGTHGDSQTPATREHLHYVGLWPVNQIRFARYRSSSATGIASDESLDRVSRVIIDVYSDQYRDTITHEYTDTPEIDDDIRRYVGLVEKNQTFTLNLIGGVFATNAGVSLHHEGNFVSIPDPKITVTLRRGNDTRTAVWRASGKPWNAGLLSAYALKHPSFNGMSPERVDVELEFPGSSKKTSLTWTIANK